MEKQPQLLIFDDNRIFLEEFTGLLSKHGYTFQVGTSKSEWLPLLQEVEKQRHFPGAILLDKGSEGIINGDEISNRLRKCYFSGFIVGTSVNGEHTHWNHEDVCVAKEPEPLVNFLTNLVPLGFH